MFLLRPVTIAHISQKAIGDVCRNADRSRSCCGRRQVRSCSNA